MLCEIRKIHLVMIVLKLVVVGKGTLLYEENNVNVLGIKWCEM